MSNLVQRILDVVVGNPATRELSHQGVKGSRRLTEDDFLEDRVLYLVSQKDQTERLLDEGFVATGAFFTFLPTGYLDKEAAISVGSEKWGEDFSLVQFDMTNLQDYRGFEVSSSKPDEVVIWRDIAASDLALAPTSVVPSSPSATI